MQRVRPTVNDIARHAGVSLATVDRVLNDRPGVHARTVARVQEAVANLGYTRDVAAANLARQRSYRLVFVLPAGASSFLDTLRTEIDCARARAVFDRMQIDLIEVAPHDPHALARNLDALHEVDGVAIMAPETPPLRDAVRRLKARGTGVVALVSDLPNSGCDHFVGINNMAAGRTAGLLMGRFVGRQPGRILVLAGSMLARDHVERRLGFDAVLAQDFPHLTVMPSIEGRDTADLIAALLPPVLDATPDILGIYALGAGLRGLGQALAGRPPLTVIVHDLTPYTRAALAQGTIDAVIGQDTGHLIRSTLRLLKAHRDGTDVITAQERIRIDISLRENLA